jgi:hypothetical protein
MSSRDLLARLTTMSSAELRSEWLGLYKRPAPDMTTDLLRRGIAYRLQERASGGLAPATMREMTSGIQRLPTSARCRDRDRRDQCYAARTLSAYTMTDADAAGATGGAMCETAAVIAREAAAPTAHRTAASPTLALSQR